MGEWTPIDPSDIIDIADKSTVGEIMNNTLKMNRKPLLCLFSCFIFLFVLLLSVNSQAVTAQYVLIDDYAGTTVPGRDWYYSRIGGDRGVMGDGSYSVDLGNGKASVVVNNGWGGVWTSLIHQVSSSSSIDPNKILGEYVQNSYQARITGVRIDLINGSGKLKVEIKDSSNNNVVPSSTFNLTGGAQTITMPLSLSGNIKKLNWLVDGTGKATVDKIWFEIQTPKYANLAEMAFLFSFASLSQCYDPASGLVRDRARWPVQHRAAAQSIGSFALIAAIAADLGYINQATALAIVSKTKAAILKLPKNSHQLNPHFIRYGQIEPGSEWSTIDTAICLITSILACEYVGIDTTGLEARLMAIDWADLSDNHTRSISWGYKENNEKISARIDVFGSESLISALAYASSTGKIAKIEAYDAYPPTFDGSGFNDEMASLLFPPPSRDAWGNDWIEYRKNAYLKQVRYLRGKSSYLGLSACEFPHPWEVPGDKVYQAFGVGGHNNDPNDGSDIVGYTVIAPHYSAMLASSHINDFKKVFGFLVSRGIFSPLNNVESYGIMNNNILKFNELKSSWNLSLQALGISKYLSGEKNFLPFKLIAKNNFLNTGYRRIVFSGNLAPVYLLLLK